MTKKKETERRDWKLPVMSPEEAMELFDRKGVRYEVCDTPVPVLSNKVNCGKPLDAGEQLIEDYYYLPKSMVGLHPVMEIPAQGESMIDADIHEGDLLQTEIGAMPMDGDIVIAEVDKESTAKVYFTDEQKRHWLCPMNKRFEPIRLTADMEVRIAGVVRCVVKKMVRRSFSECMAIVKQVDDSKRQEGDVFQRLAKAVRGGFHLFWAASAWAVAYGVVRDCFGYDGSVSDFERRAENLTITMTFEYNCTPGKVQRTISNHPYMRLHIDKWKENGASIREIVLVEYLKKNI